MKIWNNIQKNVSDAMRQTAHLLCLVLLLSFAAGCGGNSGVTDKQQEVAGHDEREVARSANITLSKEAVKTMGLELQPAAYRAMEQTLPVTGEIAKDTEKVSHVTPQGPGTLVRMNVKYGDLVKEGDVLGKIQTPQAMKVIVSPCNGVVTAVNVNPGQQVDELTSLASISDLRTIDANFDVYEKDAGNIKVGQRIKVVPLAFSDKVFAGRITFISPRVDENTRTIKVRAEIDNSAYLLKFGMFVAGHIVVSEGRFLSVPSKAVQKINDKAVVFVANANSEFVATEIQPGFEDKGYVRVLKGLKPGNDVAVNGSFLLKSELQKNELEGE